MRIGSSRFLAISAFLALAYIAGCSDKPAQTPTAPASSSPLSVVDWGPRDTRQGVPANPQPDGASAIWIRVKGIANDSRTVVKYDGRLAVSAVVQPDLVTAPVPKELIDRAGEYAVTIEEPSGRRTLVGNFKVLP